MSTCNVLQESRGYFATQVVKLLASWSNSCCLLEFNKGNTSEYDRTVLRRLLFKNRTKNMKDSNNIVVYIVVTGI